MEVSSDDWSELISQANFIGGTGETQSRAAWLVPITIQILPALVLGVGIMFLPQSPRWLMDQGRDEECLAVLADLRRQPANSPLVQIEYLEIKSQKVFERRVSEHDHPTLQDGTAKSNFLLGVAQYKSLITNRANLKRTLVAVLTMTFQQWTGRFCELHAKPSRLTSRCEFHSILRSLHLRWPQSRRRHHLAPCVRSCRSRYVPRHHPHRHLSRQLGTKASLDLGRHHDGCLSLCSRWYHRTVQGRMGREHRLSCGDISWLGSSCLYLALCYQLRVLMGSYVSEYESVPSLID